MNLDQSFYSFKIEEKGTYMIFTEHHPNEFDMIIAAETGATIDPQNPTEYKGLGHSPNFPRSL
ncbi:hypothetical protein [Alkalihalophilus pseudofirmus]|nr:hypothetical protein [Alkalihalophilus pseudofirmus]